MQRLIKTSLTAVVAATVGWWLFADTVRRHSSMLSRLDSIVQDSRVTIRFSHFGSYEDYEFWRETIHDFHQTNPKIRIKQEFVVGLAGHYHTKLRQQILASHSFESSTSAGFSQVERTRHYYGPDLAMIQLAHFHEMANHFDELSDVLTVAEPTDDQPSDSANLQDLGEQHAIVSGIDRDALTAFKVKGRQMAVPFCGGNLALYGNLECFERASRFHGREVPLPHSDWTVEDFVETARLLTCDFDDDGTIDQFGFWHPRWIYFLPFFWAYGVEVIDPDSTQWGFTGEEAEAALALYRNLLVNDRVCPRDDEVPQLFQDTGFLTGRVAMCVNGPWFQPFLDQTELRERYIIDHVPTGPAGRATRITYDGIVMAPNLTPSKRSAAAKFLRHTLSKPVQDRIATTGRALPVLKESLAAFSLTAEDPRRRVFVDALRYSRLQPALPRFWEVDRAINEHLNRYLNPDSTISARQALEHLANDRAILAAFRQSE